MKALPLIKYPDKILLQKSSFVEKISPEIIRLLDEMAATMYANSGIGLAAPQIGISRQFAVIDVGNGLIKMINPRIIRKIGCDTMEEGCLSLPLGFQVKVKRSKEIEVEFIDDKGEKVSMKADGILAKAVQHEVDHLIGILIIDRTNPLKRILLKKRLRLSNK